MNVPAPARDWLLVLLAAVGAGLLVFIVVASLLALHSDAVRQDNQVIMIQLLREIVSILSHLCEAAGARC